MAEKIKKGIMMWDERSEPYKTTHLLDFEEWKDELMDRLSGHQTLIHKYKELIMTGANPERAPFYKERIEDLTDAVLNNLQMLNRAEIERDYMVFYREDGALGMSFIDKTIKDNLYSRKRTRERMSI